MRKEFYIGWDVGAWNCDRNSESRDAVVILDSAAEMVGKSFWGNLKVQITTAANTRAWLEDIFQECEVPLPQESACVLAIDTPLGFSDAFRKLINGRGYDDSIDEHSKNSYLFRETEKYLFGKDYKPLSAVKDMIGSQATKGIHVRNKFAPNNPECGVWTDWELLTVIETYPATCANNPEIQAKVQSLFPDLPKQDVIDAYMCALIAHKFGTNREELVKPGDSIPKEEGWIWTLKTGKSK